MLIQFTLTMNSSIIFLFMVPSLEFIVFGSNRSHFLLSVSTLLYHIFFRTVQTMRIKYAQVDSSVPMQEQIELDVKEPNLKSDSTVKLNSPSNGIQNCSAILLLAISAAVLGGAFQFGFAIGNVANTIPIIKSTFNTTDLFISVFVSGNPIGGLFGALLAGFVADSIGRTRSMILNLIPFLIGCLLMSTAPNQYLLVVGRIVMGFGVGIGSGLTNIFLSEIAPISIRGGVGMLYGVVLTVGTLASYLLSMPQVIGDGNIGWRLFFAIPILPALYQSVVLLCCPESPRYLAFNKQDTAAAKQALARYRRVMTEDEAEDLIPKQSDSVKVLSFGELFSDPGHRLALGIGIGLHAAQQLSAINAVLSYTPNIFAEANVGSPVIATVATGSVNVLVAVVAAPLTDKLGRRLIMWAGLLLMTAAYCGLAVTQSCAGAWNCGGRWTEYVAIASVFLFIIGFAGGAGSIPWLMVSELFVVEARGKASSICVGVNWICSLISLLTYETIQSSIHPYTFFLYMTIVLVSFLFVLLFMPETRLKSVEQIRDEIRDQAKKVPPFVF